MFSGVPNFIYTFGYTNASWTLKADLTAGYASRLFAYMDKHGIASATPVAAPGPGDAALPRLLVGLRAARGRLHAQAGREGAVAAVPELRAGPADAALLAHRRRHVEVHQGKLVGAVLLDAHDEPHWPRPGTASPLALQWRLTVIAGVPMAALFQPLKIGELALDNRIVIAPMCQYSASDGDAGDWHMIHLGHLALSGAALLIIEATAVTADGRITPSDLGLYSDANEAALARVLAAVRAQSDIRIGMQLAHAGRKASSRAPWDGGQQIPSTDADGWVAQAPSAIPHSPGEEAPHALDAAGLARVRDAFALAATRAARLGIDGAGAPRGARLPAAPVPVADREPAHRRVRRQPGEPHAFSARGVRRRARGVPGRPARVGAAVGHRLGRRRLGRGRQRRLRPGVEGARLRRDPRQYRRRVAAAEDPARPGIPGAVSPRASRPRPGCRPSRWA